ncbi:hypothetical protein HYFRA_00001794 [Hymenoscyphus fraxineus]|uniref:Multicopper oxidase n=1 Tax=Hymenoscyphus fraxineus TaxID=746836 RepID=A0A9N9KJG1_9HELO|nr:hypothetical protein HYFRA_00001794 [Hymenoscyphus fraxineus]
MSWVFSFLEQAATLTAGLSQFDTNGLSKHGCLDAPILPHFLTNNPLPHGFPWGNTQPGGKPPVTGVTRYYDFTISRAFKAPDGYQKSLILINDQFPGPTIEANWGDIIQVKVTNGMNDTAEGVTLHWHGQPQKSSPWYDGVPGISQCPIAPGSTFTYSFIAESFGSSWYHSHMSAQYTDGLYGPLIVYGPTQLPYDTDLGPIQVSDYVYASYLDVIDGAFQRPTVFPQVDNNLINGKGIANCTETGPGKCTPAAGLPKFRFEQGKTHLLRLINTGSEGSQKFSIDNHSMTIIANDYVPIEPYMTNVVTLGIGQRTDVLVKATGKANEMFWMRSEIDLLCLGLNSTNSLALGAIYYQKANTSLIPKTTGHSWQSNNCANDPLNQTVPLYPAQPPAMPAITESLLISVGLNESGFALFYVNNSTFRTNYNNPLLLLTNLGNTSYPDNPEWNVYNFHKNSSMRLVLQNVWATPHPMHLHGHDFWVLAEGKGDWDGEVTNPDNPMRRDTHLMMPGTPDEPSYLVIEWKADNPGVWPLHCHTSLHVSGGLLVNIQEHPELVQKYQIPYVMAQTCRDWTTYSGSNLVDQIDSGL